MSELGIQQPTREKPGGGGNGYFMLVALLVVLAHRRARHPGLRQPAMARPSA